MEMIDSPLDVRCGAEKETSAHVFCECEVLATLRHTYWGSFFLNPENVRSRILSTSMDLLLQSALQHLVVFRPAQLSLNILSRKVLLSAVASGTSNPQLGGEPGI
jgi:hypothetical protein